MEKRELIEVLQDWNFWRKELDIGVRREAYLDRCLRFLKTNAIIAIIGIRRAGKSYIMRQMIKELMTKGTEGKSILMVNFEDQRFGELSEKLLDNVYEAYLEFLKPGKKPFIFLDEVHNVPKWEKWVRTMHELGKAKIIVSGSSAKLLAGELASALTGRHLDVIVFPLSFKEFIQFKNLEIMDDMDLIAKKAEIKALFNEYLEFGGFPDVILSNEKKQILLTYFDDILTKDIERRYALKKSGKLRALARFYLTNASSLITFNSLKDSLNTTPTTIERYSLYLEEANMIFFVKRFSFKVREQEKAARKVYSADVGLANAVGFKFSSNLGRVAENVVAIELRRSPLNELYYWKNSQQEEVDFVIKKGAKVEELIQVCWDIDAYGAKKRELRALLKAGRELKCGNLTVITGEKEGEERIGKHKIRYLPLWRYLLEGGLPATKIQKKG